MISEFCLIAFDFDGVFTDNKVICDTNGKEYVTCSRSDSYGLTLLHREIKRFGCSTETMVVTTERNKVVYNRCKKMKIACFDGVTDKEEFIRKRLQMLRKSGIEGKVLFAGNDLNDKGAMIFADYSCAPADGHPEIKALATRVFGSNGGDGFVRDVVEWIMSS